MRRAGTVLGAFAAAFALCASASTAAAQQSSEVRCESRDSILKIAVGPEPSGLPPAVERATRWPEAGIVQISTDGARISVEDSRERVVDCAGPRPTTASVDTIRVRPGRKTDVVAMTVDLRDGPLAPGATPEADGSSEIELEANVRRGFLAEAALVLGDAADTVALGRIDGSWAANLNAGVEPAPDADISVQGDGITVVGGRGDDSISGAPAIGLDPVPGIGRRVGPVIIGGAGRDQLTGTATRDLIDGGRGHDAIAGAGHSDLIVALDGGVDELDCGGGNDRWIVADRADRRTDCERVWFKDPFDFEDAAERPQSGQWLSAQPRAGGRAPGRPDWTEADRHDPSGLVEALVSDAATG